jgi:hypothetical protein
MAATRPITFSFRRAERKYRAFVYITFPFTLTDKLLINIFFQYYYIAAAVLSQLSPALWVMNTFNLESSYT